MNYTAFRLSLAILLVIIALLTMNSHHEPDHLKPVVEMQVDQRFFHEIGPVDFLLEGHGKFENIDGNGMEFQHRFLKIGSYFRLQKHIKWGIFYRLQSGKTHSDDWVTGSKGGWWWQDSTKRAEHGWITNLLFRFQLGFLPGKNWIFELKPEYDANFYYDSHYNKTFYLHTLKARPGLTYFVLNKGKALTNLSLKWELYFPLNYAPKGFYGGYLYLSNLWNIAPFYEIGLTLTYSKIRWVESEDVVIRDLPDYTVFHRSILLGLTSIVRF